MRRALLVVLWFVATGAITIVAYIAVNVAGASVSDRPLSSVVANGAGSTTSLPTSTIAGTPTTVTSSGTSSTTSTTGPVTSSVTSAVTTTSAADSPWKQTTVNSLAGAVIVSYRPGEVRLESVVPVVGVRYDIDKAGPDEVRVEFEGGGLKADVRVRWENGALLTTIDEGD